jgi:N6-adenosine-specific RNA methylase IME4
VPPGACDAGRFSFWENIVVPTLLHQFELPFVEIETLQPTAPAQSIVTTASFDALPRQYFGAISADPPIAFKTRSAKGEDRSPQRRYRCMSYDELIALPVAAIAAPDAFLFLWIPLRSVFLVEPFMNAWGFEFSGTAFVWVKPNKTKPGWTMGTGFGTRKNAEVCWLGRCGAPQRKSKGVHELIIAHRREHSRKPDEIYPRIEQLCAGPYCELFARQQWLNWTAWGDEVDLFDGAQP